MIKPEWGVKRGCPKCNTRFYDLAHDDPVTCIACGHAWTPEPLLKSKAPLPYDAPKPVVAEVEPAEEALGEEDLDLDEATAAADEAEDLGGEDDLAEVVDGKDDEER